MEGKPKNMPITIAPTPVQVKSAALLEAVFASGKFTYL